MYFIGFCLFEAIQNQHWIVSCYSKTGLLSKHLFGFVKGFYRLLYMYSSRCIVSF